MLKKGISGVCGGKQTLFPENIMDTFCDYALTEKIDETRSSLVYRGLKEGDDSGEKVIVKLLNIDNPSPSEIARFNKEYDLIKTLKDEAVIKVYDVVESDGRVALIMEDFDGISLERYLTDSPLPLETFLLIGIKIAGVLDKLHQKNIVHKDIKPHNLLFNEKTREVKLSDFGISAELTHARENIDEAALADGTLAYMAPEQTGRMNRSVSSSSDLYSLGVTFYELLTGRLPFDDITDPVAYFHAHIAKRPVPPGELNSALPSVLSEIVMKLMAKEADDRYQSAAGLQYDLQVCLDQLHQEGKIENFAIGSRDFSPAFSLPRKLIARESENAQLMRAFHRVEDGGQVFFMIAGDAGTGKSFFVMENRQTIESKRGFVCAGKFEAQDRAIPYSGFVATFQNLLNQLLAESPERIAAWRDNLLQGLGANGRLLTDIIPELTLIIGEQPEVPALDSEEARNRFNLVFKNFIRVFAKKSHPLTVILDDLHLADPASLELLNFLAGGGDLGYFFVIGTYRQDAPDLKHLKTIIKSLEEGRVDLEHLSLAAFSPQQVNLLIAGALKCDPDLTMPLAEIVHKKTNGVPFFVNQFLESIYKEGMLWHAAEQGWQWDEKQISRLKITDNVVEIMTEKIRTLSGSVLEVITRAACVGSRFDLELVSKLVGRPVTDVLEDMSEAVDQDIIRQEGEDYRFQHEKIREAAYSLVPDAEKPSLHWQIGELLLDRSSGTETGLRDAVFYIVRHLNAGVEMAPDDQRRQELAWLNFLAGEKAKGSTAVEAAVDYFSRAASLMKHDKWTTHYDFCWALYTQLGESLFLSGNTAEADRMFEELLENARNNIDRADVYCQLVTLHTVIDKPDKALEIGLRGLALLNVKLPQNPNKATVLLGIIKVRLAQGRTRTEDLAALPALNDPRQKAIMSLLSAIGAPAYYANPTLFAVTITRGVRLSLRYGLPDLAAYGMIAMGLIMGSRMGFYDYGYRLGKSGLKVMKRFNDIKSFARSYFIYAYFILPWCEYARGCFQYLSLAYQYGMETGDMIFTGHSINVTAAYRIFSGMPLDSVLEDHKAHKAFLEKLDSPFILNNYLDTYEIVWQLKGGSDEDEEQLLTKWDDREARLKAIEDENLQLGMFIHYVKRNMVMFLFGHFQECYDISCKAEEIVEYAMGTLYVAEHYFFGALAAAKLHAEAPADRKKEYAGVIRKGVKKYKKWAASCPENFLHPYHLLRAEQSRVSGKKEAAADFYHRALASAKENAFLQNEAIIGELAAEFYFNIGYEEIGRAYISEARNAYHRWGARAKAKGLEQLYPDVGSILQVRSGTGETSSTITGSVIDLSTLRKTLKTIAEEKIHSRMVEKIIRVSVEFAGAQKGMLIFRKLGERQGQASSEIFNNLFVEAEWLVDSKEVTLMQSTPLAEKGNFSPVVVNYVIHSARSVVVHNAQEPQQELPTLQSEPYIKNNGVKSILCMPVMVNADSGDPELIGLLYFENNLTSHAFTRERIETLEIITLSAAGRLELSRKAVTDGLTGLYNHDYFQNMLQQEVLLAKRKGRELSVVMIDIDHFKHFNDQWGHQAGDLVLKEVASLIRESCRSSDIVARYGGEEIALLLHETSPEDAFGLAETIRQKIQALRIKYMDNQQLHVTISLGVSGFPAHAKDRKNLVKKADDALYLSKRNGRNRTTLSS